jgi:hypothetical protein
VVRGLWSRPRFRKNIPKGVQGVKGIRKVVKRPIFLLQRGDINGYDYRSEINV